MKQSLLKKVAWVGDEYINGPIRGIVLEFSGLGSAGMKGGADAAQLEWGQSGALVVVPYHNPWAWMNPATVDFVDELVDGLFAQYDLKPETPIIATGCSMGGYGALLYSLYAKRPIAACLANCPPCDLPVIYLERDDVPRTLHSAFGSYGDITEILSQHSPLHQAAKMPDIPYLIIHGGKDTAVHKEPHSDKLVAALREYGRNVEYLEPADMGHCGPFDWPLQRRNVEFVLEQLR